MGDIISNNIIQAIDTIVESRLNQLKLDRTIKAIINSVEDVTLGIYTVQFQNNIKTAYAIDPSEFYYEGDTVLVKIPENDLSNKILIEKLDSNNENKKIQNQSKKSFGLVPLAQYGGNQSSYNFKFNMTHYDFWNRQILLKIVYNKSERINAIDDFGLKLGKGTVILNTLNFLGNYIDHIGLLEQEIIFILPQNESPFNFEIIPYYSRNNMDITINSLTCQPILTVDYNDSLYTGMIYQQDSTNNKFIARIIDSQGNNITDKCNKIEWYTKINNKNWEQLVGYNGKNAVLSKSADNIKINAYYDSHIIEAFWKKVEFTQEDNLKGFLYDQGELLFINQMPSEHILRNSNENYLWRDMTNIILLPGKLYDYTTVNTMIKTAWIDNYNNLHYTIKTNYNINNYKNYFSIFFIDQQENSFRQEIYFAHMGDQGTHNSGYCCFVRPCDELGELTGSIFPKVGVSQTHMRALVFYQGQLIPALKLTEKNNILRPINNTIFGTENKIDILTGELPKNNFITTLITIENKPGITLSNITPLPFNEENKNIELNYPMYIRYDKTGFNPIYNTLLGEPFIETEEELQSDVERQSTWDNSYNYPKLRFISIETTVGINNWNGQSINTGDKNIIDSSQYGVGTVDEDGDFTGLVIGVKENRYGIFGYNKNENTVSILANEGFPNLLNNAAGTIINGIELKNEKINGASISDSQINGVAIGDGKININASQITIDGLSLEDYIKKVIAG